MAVFTSMDDPMDQEKKDMMEKQHELLADMLDLGAGSGPMNHAFDLKDEWKEEA